ncbi:hypothetical protein JOQ06_003998 [Pogonophryne albipinna]|uniref:C2 domain-containing protein n=1 Tax=Pogonophryne albipinna TaxID=1090488 RepID=A0AAD6ADS2_9TELE|nr:hypothetical protein JOQ06_003998 [Pogonophryne albipinna]
MRKLLPPQTDRWSDFLMKPLPHCSCLASVQDGEDGKDDEEKEALGKLEYSLDYNFTDNTLIVGILQASGSASHGRGRKFRSVRQSLHAAGPRRRSLRPKSSARTSAQSSMRPSPLRSPTVIWGCQFLVLQVFDFDRFGKHDVIGEIKIAMNSIDLAQPIQEWKDLVGGEKEEIEKLGDICISLRYVPTAGKFTINIMEAKNLKKMDVGGLSDPFVKVVLQHNGKRLKKKKTSVKQNTLNPYFNESFSFEIPFSQIQKVQVLITVYDYDKLGSNDAIGKCWMGYGASGIGIKHWSEMLANPRRPVAQWHSLCPEEEVDAALKAPIR